MDGVAVRDSAFRQRLFEETGDRLNLEPLIIEKDFWVCWTLQRLFSLADLGKDLIFKGGTTLSKVYGIIQRFSEDIDLTLNRAKLGFEGDKDPANIERNKQRERMIAKMVDACREYVCSDLRLKLEEIFSLYLKVDENPWKIDIDKGDENKQTLFFFYPRAVDFHSGFYVDPAVKFALHHLKCNFEKVVASRIM